jgi:DNA-binding transcriptional LysR family regulator
MVGDGEVDRPLLYGHEDAHDDMSGQVTLDHLRNDPYRVVLPRGHRLADRPSVHLRELADEPWVGSRSGASWFRIVADACRAEGFTPRVALSTDDYLGLQAMVASTLGVGAIPGLAVRASPQVVSLPIAGGPVVRRIWAGRTSAHPPSPVADQVVGLMREAAARWP